MSRNYPNPCRLFGYSNGKTEKFITIDPETGIGSEFSTLGSVGRDIEGLTFLLPETLLTQNTTLTTAIYDIAPSVPMTFALEQNYPNPFNPETVIRFQLPEASQVTIRIFNALGQEVNTLAEGSYASGSHKVVWNGTDKNGNQASSGVYLYQLQTEKFAGVRKMILIR